MADVTVNDLAKSVGASVERLLSQMGQAGLAHKKPPTWCRMKKNKPCWRS